MSGDASCCDEISNVSVNVPSRVGWKPILNVVVSFGWSCEGRVGLSIENGALIVGGSRSSTLPLQF